MPGRRNRYISVLQSYTRRRVFRWMTVVIALWAALYCWNFYISVARGRLHHMLHDRSTPGLALWVLGFGNVSAGVAMLFTIIALIAAMMSHLKEQLRDWRA